MDIGLRLAVVVLLVAANGFFVAAEFALVTARKTRIEQIAHSGNRSAMAVLRAIEDPNRFISACQLGITVASLALGWVGEEALASILLPLFGFLPHDAAGFTSHTAAVMLAFVLITFLHITLGEQVPKMLSLQMGERVALLTVRPTNMLGMVGRPFIALLSWFTELILRLLGMEWQSEHHQAYTAEDLKMMIRASRASGAIGEDPDRLVERALDFAHLSAHHVMVPRTEMVAMPINATMERLADVMQRHQHSRYPVYDGSADNIVGVLSVKSLVARLAANLDGTPDLRAHMTAPLFVPETIRVDRLLAEMKRQRSHLAVVVDEYGVTAGLVTLRDLMDRIAGEVGDETDMESPSVQWFPDGSALIDGLALLNDLESEHGLQFDEPDYDTLGGLVFGKLGRRPSVGDQIQAAGQVFTIEEIDGLRVSQVRMRPAENRSEGQEVATT
jgi:CBS domain containing-hemolysin-like protein